MPRLFGRDPSKEKVTVKLDPGSPRPEWTMNSDRIRPGRCPDCDDFGSIGFVFGDTAGRVPCTHRHHRSGGH
ncbi:hypothetical protein Ga0074812_1572 [Parafrankia irregularis]|uniref:Uncharacterized protein n=1 Tax=Parafrankia irregularis TaxID=795642 RepID=A0A0S4R264_9ACTN|nr:MULTISPECIES: hypothetical protein [Parafrankia]MBE3206800.1 hypothetical protein [Parafrankia sp. CH37]MBE3206825.1 hypothetical protein [Parafrankia sp. CH37]CUU61112.1 hypothetical protein Ga0074812_1572 [Parafrankia irregularis]